MGRRIFVTGIGTDIGKTVVSAILVQALEADYWKPVQAGTEGTDTEFIEYVTKDITVHRESYKLQMPASPHIAARSEKTTISIEKIRSEMPVTDNTLIIEGPGGLLVPLNEKDFVTDLIPALEAEVILVSRNYLGSINHSLLTARVCRELNLPVIGWIFNDQYLSYEDEIVQWSGYPRLASIPQAGQTDSEFVQQQASRLKTALRTRI